MDEVSGEGDPLDEAGAPLFILSPADRDALSQLAAEAGWRAVAARRVSGAEQRYLTTGAQVALVDIRGADHLDALERVRALASAVAATGGAMLLYAGAEEIPEIRKLIEAGATHYLIAPTGAVELSNALASASALVERLGGGPLQTRSRHAIRRSDALVWREQDGAITLSPELARRLGAEGSAVTAGRLLRLIPWAERRLALSAIRQAALSRTAAAFAHGVEGQPGQRLVQHLYPTLGGLSGEIELLDENERQPADERDLLTGLTSRAAALRWIGARLAEGSGATLVLLSISQFDRMNAAYGQMVGDALLARVARRIARASEDVGGVGVVARLAGTEFLVGIGEGGTASIDRAVLIARRAVGAVSRPFSAGDHLIRLTARCGIAEARAGDDATKLLRRAGAAVAEARAADGEGIRVAGGRKGRELDEDRLETDLRLAINRGEIGIVFQPQYRMVDDVIVGVEALARWNHPQHGSLSAALLFAAAERSDYLLPLSAHIQAEAVRIAAAWPAALGGLRLSVNLTAADIAQPDFLTLFLAMVDGSGFARGRLTVEITESGLIENVEEAARLLAALREAGLKVAIDDFGTGYSSLAYLKGLPLDYLKIDSGLAKDIGGSPRDRVVVRGIIDIAKSLGMSVIAEGVENEHMRMLLAREGCDVYQGFLRSPGVSSDELAALVGES